MSQKCWVVSSMDKYGSNVDKAKCWVKMQIKNVQLKVKVEVGVKFEITFVT